ncbi:cupin domain-containing protein [Neobacillus sp.]|uniref:cupin domain-containing protein n=1 Tax=Neobacillus sp. TaxID=2675273 RepID=UPI00289CFFE7|nr:cupin domain-containing protein [Neobacillus sp.]
MAFVVKKISTQEFEQNGVDTWEPWENTTHKAQQWEVEETETFYVHEGEVNITVGEITYNVTENMLVSLPKGLVCIWDIPEYLKKVYKLNFELD